MRPLGQTRPLLAYGVPAAAGLAVGGTLLAQGEDPGSTALGGLAAGIGARGGLGAARLAGRYSPQLVEAIQEKAIVPLGNIVGDIGRKIPAGAKSVKLWWVKLPIFLPPRKAQQLLRKLKRWLPSSPQALRHPPLLRLLDLVV